MGKKGGKKEHNVDKAAENAEPNLSTIPEETNLEQEKPESVEQPTQGAEVPAKSGVEVNKTEDSDQKPGKAKKGKKGSTNEDPQTEEESSKKKGGKKGKKAVKEEEDSNKEEEEDNKELVEKEVTKKSKGKKGKKQELTTVDKEVQNESELAVPSKPILAQKDSQKFDKSRVSISERVTSFDVGEKKKKGKGGKRKSGQSVRDSTTFEEYEDDSDIPPKTRTRSVSVSKRSSFPSSGTRFSLYQTESDTAGRQRLSIMSSDMSIGSSVESEEIPRKKSLEEKKKSKKDKKKPQEKEKKKAKSEKKKPEKPVKAGKKGEMDYDEAKKLLDDLKQQAKELGVEDASAADDTDKDDKKGPKKKASKKEKAKMTAEMAEKAKAEMEAQAKRLEEMIRKKKEEDRLAAIEKDKRETLEQGLRMEQLQDSVAVIEEIINANVLITKEEKSELEWKKYLECGKLPNPAVCAEMNTYLHLWDIDLDKTKIEDASERTTDALKLLGELDDLIETISDEDKNKLENWYWIRQLFRDYQANCLDVATYRLLRNVEQNLNRINIPTADFNFKDDHVTVCVWLRVMLPIPLPNPRRPPKPRIDISFNLMDLTALFPITVDCENAAIRAMYLKYDHLSDLSDTYRMPEVPPDFNMDMLSITKKEWRNQLKYKYDNRDVTPIKPVVKEVPESEQTPTEGVTANDQPPQEEEKKIKFENTENKEWIDRDDEVPLVPFKQLKPTASEFALNLEDELYNETRTRLQIAVPENVINLRKFVILGGVFHLNLLAQPPQPQDFVTMDMTITALYLPKKLKVLPFKVIYTPYIPPEPEPTSSDTSIRKLPEELEEEIKKQEEELDKLIFINVKWPSHVIFLELPVVCRWDEENSRWTSDDVYDVKHNEDKCMVSFRTGVFGIYGLATCRYSNLPFQAYDIKPEADDSVTVQLTAAILMLEFNVKDGLIAVTQLQNSPNMTMQDSVGKYMKLHKLKKTMMEAGIDIFPDFDAFCYVNGCCEKHWPMEKHLYYNMAQISNSFNFSWSRWNLPADRRKIVVQMREYFPDKGKQKNHQMLLVTPLKAAFIECTEVSQTFSEKEVDTPKFAADLYHLMKTTSGIFVRNKVSKASKQNVYTLAQFLISIRVLSFS